MIIDRAPYRLLDGEPFYWQVTVASGETHKITGEVLLTEGGALIIVKPGDGDLEVAFGPGAWLEVQRA